MKSRQKSWTSEIPTFQSNNPQARAVRDPAHSIVQHLHSKPGKPTLCRNVSPIRCCNHRIMRGDGTSSPVTFLSVSPSQRETAPVFTGMCLFRPINHSSSWTVTFLRKRDNAQEQKLQSPKMPPSLKQGPLQIAINQPNFLAGFNCKQHKSPSALLIEAPYPETSCLQHKAAAPTMLRQGGPGPTLALQYLTSSQLLGIAGCLSVCWLKALK